MVCYFCKNGGETYYRTVNNKLEWCHKECYTLNKLSRHTVKRSQVKKPEVVPTVPQCICHSLKPIREDCYYYAG